MVRYSEEFADIIYSYIASDYSRTGKPVSFTHLRLLLARDGGDYEPGEIREALSYLEDSGLIEQHKGGWATLGKSAAFRRQMEMSSVRPFTRQFGEVAESHEDKRWDFREGLKKPGGKYGLLPTSQYFTEDKAWRGLTLEKERGK